MTDQKRKKLYWLFKVLSVIVSCALPIWAICEKFPLWAEDHGTGHSVGVGIILIAIVLIIIFRRTVFDFIKAHFDLKYAPPLVIWLVMLVISYILVYLGEVMRDMTTVFWMGFIGCCIGTFLTFISERFKAKEVTSNE
jgi:ABC-type phosphate/phosphonate transport system permease subunit